MEIRPGSVLRRGADKLTALELKTLYENPEQVDRIIVDINARRDVFLKTEAAAKARLEAAEKAEADLVAHEAVVVSARAVLEDDIAEWAVKHKADMEALTRRTSEVFAKEAASTERAAALDAREQELEDKAHAWEEEHRGRLEAVEAQEAAAEARDGVLVKQSAGLDQRRNRLQTVAKMVKQAAASLE